MSGLYLHTSNRLESLADALAEVVSVPLASPLAQETVAVQSRGMERWLCLQLAARLGSWANYRFPFPNALIRELLAVVLGSAEESPLLTPEPLAWRLFELLPTLLPQAAFAPLRPYLAPAEDAELRRWQLAWRIADAFDQYQVFRHELLRDWEAGRSRQLGGHEAWQAELWRLLAGDGVSHRARLVAAFTEQLATAAPPPVDALPQRLCLFGVTTLPPLHLEVLQGMARLLPIHLFHLNPCRGYWYELKTPGEEAALLRRAADQGLLPEELWLEQVHPLLASCGRSGRNFFRRLLDCELTPDERFVPAPGDSLLATLQRDLLDADQWPPSALRQRAVDDASLRIHACHGALREVEVLYDQLLRAFSELEGLSPREVLVMAPDIDDYAPLIEAVFGGDERPLLPYAVSDRAARRANPLSAALERLFALVESRCGSAELLDLLELPAVARRFALGADDLQLIRTWVERLQVRAGLGTPEGDGPAAVFTWQHAIDRLLLGLALPQGDSLYGELLPADGGEGSNAAALGALASFINRIEAWRSGCRERRTPAAWADYLVTVLDDFFDPQLAGAELQRLRNHCATLAQEALVGACQQPVAFAVVRARLDELLAERSSHGFLSGPITFCTLQPMRSVPFRVIALLGMNDGAFPRQSRPPGFDLLALQPHPGDPARRDEDRYLFLEALLSARDRLLITWQGHDPRDASPAPPSVVVGELLDSLEAAMVSHDGRPLREHLVIQQRLQPFSRDYFRPGSPLTSSNPAWHAAVQALQQRDPQAEPPPLLAAPLAAPQPPATSVELAQLERCWAHPAKFFLQQRLQLRLVGGDEGLEEREPFLLGALESYQLGQELTGRLLRGETLSELYPVYHAAGRLPAGVMGARGWQELTAEIGAFAAQLQPLLPLAPEPRSLTLPFGALQLHAQLATPGPRGLLVWRFAKLKAKDRLTAWLRHLTACAAGAGCATVLVGSDATCSYAPLAASVAQATLTTLLEHYQHAWCAPLPFFPAASLAYAEVMAEEKGSAAALAAARKVWEGSDYSRGEADDPYYRLAFNSDPLSADFAALALAVYAPLLAAETAGAA